MASVDPFQTMDKSMLVFKMTLWLSKVIHRTCKVKRREIKLKVRTPESLSRNLIGMVLKIRLQFLSSCRLSWKENNIFRRFNIFRRNCIELRTNCTWNAKDGKIKTFLSYVGMTSFRIVNFSFSHFFWTGFNGENSGFNTSSRYSS